MATINETEAPNMAPPAVSGFLRRRMFEGAGLALLAGGLLVAVALISHTASDPSFNVTADAAVQNFLGYPGAAISDLLLQSLGLVAILAASAPIVWGVRMISHRGLRRPVVRIILLMISAVLLGGAIAQIPTPAFWPSQNGFGGAAGDLLGTRLAAINPAPEVWFVPITIAIGLISFATALWCHGVSRSEWRAIRHDLGANPLARAVSSVRRGLGAGLGIIQLAMRALTAGTAFAHRRVLQTDSRIEPDLGQKDPDDSAYPGEADTFAHDASDTSVPSLRAERGLKIETSKPGTRKLSIQQGALDLASDEDYHLPSCALLATAAGLPENTPSEEVLDANARMLEAVLQDFGIKGEIVKIRSGPVVTLYELEPAPGTKSSRVVGLADDIARSMSAISVRVAVVPGRNVIGIELPNNDRETVYLRDILEAPAYEKTDAKLPIALGKDIGGAPEVIDLARTPHLLIAGTTGSGKSVAVNTMILSILYRLTPEQCRFIMIDPKMLELSIYDGIPHLLSPVVTDPRKAIVALKWTVREMESRYRAMSKLGVRNIDGYNTRLAAAREKGETLKRRVQTGFDSETGKPVFEDEALDLTPLPYVVVVIDEVADLMMVAGKDIEGAVQRLAQMARAAGIHVVMATQRPSVDVITGTIKANFPTRISFQVTSKIDSRTILGEQGAEQLLGQGDMLHMAGGGRVTRIHGPFVSDEEVEEVVNHLRAQGEPEYNDSITEEDEVGDPLAPYGLSAGGGADGDETGDRSWDEAVALVSREGKASTSFIQRHLKIGYNRAATIIERMESEGVVSPANHVGKREVLVGDHAAQ